VKKELHDTNIERKQDDPSLLVGAACCCPACPNFWQQQLWISIDDSSEQRAPCVLTALTLIRQNDKHETCCHKKIEAVARSKQ
jgi:hypothetical protein